MKNRFIKPVLLCVFSTVLSVPAVSASLVISELFYDASGTDAGQVFVELFGTPGESLDGLVLEGINGTGGTVYTSLDLSGVIPGDGVFVIGDDSGGSTSVPNVDLIADVDYQNGPDSVVLRNGSIILDAVGYGSFGGGSIFAGEGAAAPDPASGSSIARFNPLQTVVTTVSTLLFSRRRLRVAYRWSARCHYRRASGCFYPGCCHWRLRVSGGAADSVLRLPDSGLLCAGS